MSACRGSDHVNAARQDIEHLSVSRSGAQTSLMFIALTPCLTQMINTSNSVSLIIYRPISCLSACMLRKIIASHTIDWEMCVLGE